MNRLAFDLGGTHVRAAIVDATQGRLLSPALKEQTRGYASLSTATWDLLRASFLHQLSGLRYRLDPERAIRAATLAFPGPVDSRGTVYDAPTLWGQHGQFPYDLAHDLRGIWPDVDVLVLNDVTAAGYRYAEVEHDLCVFTVSSGVGNKVFVQGRPLLGPLGSGGEIGHLRLDSSPKAPRCECGGLGHLGAIASGRGTVSRARTCAMADLAAFRASAIGKSVPDPTDITAENIADAYRAGDDWVTRLLQANCVALGFAIASIHLATGVERFVFIGGFALALGVRFIDGVSEAARVHCWRGERRLSVSLGLADDCCALIGGARAWRPNMEKQS